LEKLENMLETKSKGRKYVAGQLFDDVEAADLAKKDMEKIYALAAEKGIPLPEKHRGRRRLPLLLPKS